MSTTSPLDILIRRLEARAPLLEDDRQAIRQLRHTVRTVEASSYVVREGDAPVHCVILLSGFAYRQKLTGDGARQIISLHIPGDALDFQNLFLDVSDHNVQTLTRAELAMIPRDALQQLVRSHPAVGHAIFVHTLIEASIFREWVLNVGRRDARTRLAHLLCEFAIRLKVTGLDEEYGYELPMTQEQLGDALGLTPVHVNRTIRGLEADGLIKRNKRNISFPDWPRLRAEAEFSDRYLHLRQQMAGAPV